MKKLVLFAAVAVAISFASCANKAEQPAEEAVEPAAEVTETVEVDSAATAIVDSAAVAVEEVAQ